MNKFIIIASLLSFNAYANTQPFGRIVDLKGEGFISFEGKTQEIRKGDSIPVGAEIVIEHHGQVSFTDNADHRFHLGNSSSASVGANIVELRSGDLWFQSLNKNDSYKIKTVNATVDYQGGEGILTYDSVKGKSQLMVINGMMKFSNLRTTEYNLTVSEGHFSFVDNAYEDGMPRDPTPVGEKTYKELISLFDHIAPMDQKSASIFKDKEHETPKREIASIDSKIVEDYKETIIKKAVDSKTEFKKLKKTKVVSKKNLAPKNFVHIYGQSSKPTVAYSFEVAPVSKSRAPASVAEEEVPKDSLNTKTISRDPVISKPYSNEYKNQNKESDKLIDDLKKL